MIEAIVNVLAGTPHWLATFILAIIPIGELRGALPVAILVYKMPVFLAVTISIIGNMFPVYFLLVFFEKGSKWLRSRSSLADAFLQKIIDRTHDKLDSKVKKYGVWALALFVAVPLPVTGAWTGALAAYVFGLPKKKAFIAILLGIFVAATIVTFLTVGISTTIKNIF